MKVCRTFFVQTISIGEVTFKRWTKNNFNVAIPAVDEKENPVPLKEYKANSRTFAGGGLTSNIKKWLDSLPKVPSHYCCSSSKKIYLESVFRSTKHLYDVYQEWCNAEGVSPIAEILFFKKTPRKENIVIHHPNKDQCDTCTKYTTKQLSEDIYKHQLKKKDDARTAKNLAEETAGGRQLVLTMDLQNVLVCPKELSSKHYFKQKL